MARFVLILSSLIITRAVSLQQYEALVPNGFNVPGYIRLGHLTEQQCDTCNALGPFGQDFSAAGHKWTQALCNKDSDGDGFTNGYELGDPNCLWSTSKPTPLRTIDLSHPGLAASTPAPLPTTIPTKQPTTKAPTSKSPTSKAPTPQPTTPSPTKTSSPTSPTPPTVPTRVPTTVPTVSPTGTPSTAPTTSSPSTTPSESTSTPTTSPTLDLSSSFGNVGYTFEYQVNLWIGHAVLMSLAFGLFFPIGVVIPAITPLRKMSSGIWFRLHKYIQILGLILAWCGFLIAMFNMAMRDQSLGAFLSDYVHGPLGVALMVIISFQGILGACRPHAQSPDQPKSKPRIAFEHSHRWIGRSIIVLGAVQIWYGFHLYATLYAADASTQNAIQVWALVQAISTPIIVAIVVFYFKFTAYRVGTLSSDHPEPVKQKLNMSNQSSRPGADSRLVHKKSSMPVNTGPSNVSAEQSNNTEEDKAGHTVALS